MNDWEQREFGEVVTRISRTSKEDDLPRVEYEDIVSGQGVLNKNIFEKDSRKQGIEFKDGDTLFGKLRPYLKNWLLADFDGIAVGDWWVLRSNVMNNKFVYSLIQTPKYQTVSNLSTGTKMPRSDWKVVSKTEFNIPVDKNEQEKIGIFFANIDNLITLHQRKLINVQKLYFRLIKNRKNGLNIQFLEYFNDWEQRKLGDTKTYFTDGNYGELYPSSKDMSDKENGVPFLRGSDFSNGYLDASHANYIKKEKHAELTSGHIKNDDIVLAVRGSLGTLGYATEANEGWNINSQLAILRTDKDEISGMFLIQYLSGSSGQKELLSRNTGTALKQLPIKQLKDIPIPIPKINEQRKIGLFFNQLDNLVTLHQRKMILRV